MNLRDLPNYLRSLQDGVAKAVIPAADKMAAGFRDRVSQDTLRRTEHAPGMFWRAVRGQPPAYASGRLARSFVTIPASTRIRATARVGNTAVYASIQEFGGATWPRTGEYMHWVNTRGPWWKRHVDIPEHPYFRPTVDEMIRDGSLRRLAASGFYDRISYYFR